MCVCVLTRIHTIQTYNMDRITTRAPFFVFRAKCFKVRKENQNFIVKIAKLFIIFLLLVYSKILIFASVFMCYYTNMVYMHEDFSEANVMQFSLGVTL